jgi:L-aminopeptidase/D-esterase-like protein
VKLHNRVTDVPGIRVGHAQDDEALTGCTVVIYEKGAVGGVDQRGGAPGTRETDLLSPVNHVEKVHAILLAGGSAFGLDAASGVMRCLEERNTGFDTRVAKVPIVPAAILYDLAIGRSDRRPDPEMGYQACIHATAGEVAEGNAGAGTGASVGKILGMQHAMKSGIGTSSVDAGGGIIVGAIVAVNAFGDVVDPKTGEVIAGARSGKIGPFQVGNPGYFVDTLSVLRTPVGRAITRLMSARSTVIGVVATNAKLTKSGATKVAQMAQDGLARTIRPAHTMVDGDTIFVMATGEKRADISTVGAYAAEAVAQAILRAVRLAKPAGGLPGWMPG